MKLLTLSEKLSKSINEKGEIIEPNSFLKPIEFYDERGDKNDERNKCPKGSYYIYDNINYLKFIRNKVIDLLETGDNFINLNNGEYLIQEGVVNYLKLSYKDSDKEKELINLFFKEYFSDITSLAKTRWYGSVNYINLASFIIDLSDSMKNNKSLIKLSQEEFEKVFSNRDDINFSPKSKYVYVLKSTFLSQK